MVRLLFTPGTRPMRRGVVLLALAALASVLLAGCSNAGTSRGSYPIDFFTEMHYAQSYKIQEPPSLSAPSVSVPTTAGMGVGYVLDLSEPFASEVEYTLSEALGLENPVPRDTAILEMGAGLFQTNCAVCHGASGAGDGPMAQGLQDAGYTGLYGADKPAPADLTANGPTVNKPSGEIFQVLTEGYTGTYRIPDRVMPPFRKLLTAEERWALVHYIRSLQGG